ncbi:MAG: histidine--tRNA ligase [Candidatus Lernaella stagnicola]|nr:histidine--tRNA ligase [Candidatus Lernaella stagnicola]
MSKKKKSARPKPRIPRGFRDIWSNDIAARSRMIERICDVYRRYGFLPLETPALEYVDALGKHLPESDTPSGGIFALRDDDEQWIALRYDLTAPLARVVAQYGQELPRPFRRFQVGPVWRMEKPGPGRFREFYQCDFDSVAATSPAADAEVCAVLAECLEALGIPAGDYVVRVNNRKVLNGVLDVIGIAADDEDAGGIQRLRVLRAIDKLDRLEEDGVRLLLGTGRKDESGDFTVGAGLSSEQIDIVMGYVGAGGADRAGVCRSLRELAGGSEDGLAGIRELEIIGELLDVMGLDERKVIFDPSVVRGLDYYTGPVFEAELTFNITDEKGNQRSVGSVAGGGRYDDLIKRFTGQAVPATGASIGVDRLLAALAMRGLQSSAPVGPVVVTVMETERLGDYQQMVQELRAAGIVAELYLGKGGYGATKKQMKYADQRSAPVVVIAGGDEFAAGEVTLKDMRKGAELAEEITDREEWRKGQPAQVSVPRVELVAKVREILQAHSTEAQ